MLVIENISKEFDSAYEEFESFKENNVFHEAADAKAYMYGLVKAMAIILNTNATNYTIKDSEMVDERLSKLNYLDN